MKVSVHSIVALLIGFRGDTAPMWVVPCTNGWKVHAPYSSLNDLTPVIFVVMDRNRLEEFEGRT